LLLGELEGAERDLVDAMPWVRESARLTSSIGFMRSVVACERGDFARAEEHARSAMAVGHPALTPSAIAAVARALCRSGDVPGALGALEGLPSSYEKLSDFLPGYWYLVRAEVFLAADRRAEAAESIARAVASLEEAAPKSAPLRAAFFARSFPNARIVAVARELGAAVPSFGAA
jgi:hypothetical protein